MIGSGDKLWKPCSLVFSAPKKATKRRRFVMKMPPGSHWLLEQYGTAEPRDDEPALGDPHSILAGNNYPYWNYSESEESESD